MEFDDTKSEYYDGWRRLTESGEADLSSLIPKSFDIVDIPKDRWPDFDRWAWDVFMRRIKDFNGKYPNYVVWDLRRMISWHDRRTWVWDHFGNGDFIRISSHDRNDRFIVVFEHESERSPFGQQDGYAPGFDFMQPLDMQEIADSDELPVGPNVAAMTEVYRFRYGDLLLHLETEDMSEELKEHLRKRREENPDRLITSPEIAALNNSFAHEPVFGGEFDDYEYLKPVEKRRRPRFVALYEQLLAGELPTLSELHKLLKHDLVSAVAFDVMHHLADWKLTKEELHRKRLNER